jgi:hypothetical protein
VASLAGSATTHTQGGLVNGTSYTASGRQRTDGGWSDPASSGPFTPVPDVPGAPASASTSNPHTEIAAGRDGVVTVSWTAAPRNGGPAIANYWWACNSSSGTPASGSVSGSTFSRIVTGLTPGATYTCGVAASFAGGNQGPPTSTGATIPSSQTELNSYVVSTLDPAFVQIANGTRGRVSFRWAALPAGFGATYTLFSSASPPDTASVGTATTGSLAVDPCGFYQFRVRTQDKWGRLSDSKSLRKRPDVC